MILKSPIEIESDFWRKWTPKAKAANWNDAQTVNQLQRQRNNMYKNLSYDRMVSQEEKFEENAYVFFVIAVSTISNNHNNMINTTDFLYKKLKTCKHHIIYHENMIV